MSQPKSIFTKNRLLYPQKRDSIDTPFWISNYDEVLEVIASKIKNTSSNRVGFYLSGQMLNEDYYVANKLAKGLLELLTGYKL